LQEVEKTREGQSGVLHELHEAQASVERLLKDNLELERRLFEKEQSLKDANSKLVCRHERRGEVREKGGRGRK
jgi:hypothetical protein